jgi:polyhydroxyalkanoate synthesis regulator phasin
MADFGDTIKKVFLAGIGAAAEGTEKAQELLNEMIKKGELTVEQGKVLNQELRHDAQEKWKNAKVKAEQNQKEEKKSDVSELLKSLSVGDLKELKKKLDAIDLEDDTIDDPTVD